MKPRIATASLAGCFGCHMSLLDIDERIIDLVQRVDFDRSPLTDVKQLGDVDIGIVEGGVANQDNLAVLLEFRRRCRVLVSLGACAVNGGIPAMRNQFSLRECLEESYVRGLGIDRPLIPDDPEIPMLLNQVRPVHEVVPVDVFVPGCPPTAETIWHVITELLEDRPVRLERREIHYD